ncbi:MAG: flagellar hook assembly protein FlgD [Hyphomonadaceae bacterium]|nr:MAG: flagellar basal-body rod modification protein FlgD [Caulobacteraceae bacterium]MBT9446032.1 flagellar hook assembly protein FlgD [Hyphomonadaceae bacterium]TPW03277.1 MAG: flagellar basal-body rod modification protein FlgD [Alphaproteobacteria bacterium]
MSVIGSTLASSTAATQTAATEARTKLSDNFDTFLSLLTAQLSNQDPLNPVDSAQFTQQLVQYSQVEQQISTNDKLETLLAQSSSAGTASAVSFIGRTAIFSSDVARLQDGAAKWSYDITGATGEARISVRDSTGREVYAENVAAGSGAKTFTWDGEDANGRDLPGGPYSLVITATDADGADVATNISVEEAITGIDFSTAGAATVMTAAGMRSFDSIRSVRS